MIDSASPASARTDVSEIVGAYRLVSDLFVPTAWRYWTELLVTGFSAWTAMLVAAAADPALVVAIASVLAVLLWYRAAMMLHELTHQTRDELPGFHLAWNLLVGIAWLLPSIMYEGIHCNHHKKTTYGTADDPEYLPLAGRTGAVVVYLGQSFLIFPALLLRFLVAAPLSWAYPPLREWLIRSASRYAINLRHVRQMSDAERGRLFRWECAILLAWWPPVALTIVGVLGWKWLVVWYAVYTGNVLVNRVRMLTAHRFGSDGTPLDHLGQFADSIDTPGGWWVVLWAPLGTRYHALHHLFPTLPYHNLRVAYLRLVTSLPHDSFYHNSRGRGPIGSILRLLSGPARNRGSS